MRRLASLTCVAALALASASRAQQPPDAVPDRPFKTVHLMAVDPASTTALKSAVADFNAEFRRQGCTGCAYHLLQMFEGSPGGYNVMIYSDWPGRSAYLRIHDSAGYQAIYARNRVFADAESKQFYGRFIEVR